MTGEYLKELRNYDRKLFCVRHKHSQKQNQHIQHLIFKINSLSGTLN